MGKAIDFLQSHYIINMSQGTYLTHNGQEGAFRSSGARIFLSVCAVFKLDPYMFFPEIKNNEEKKAEPMKKPTQSSAQKHPTEVIHYPAKPSRYIPLQEYMDLMRKIPAGKVVTCKTVEAYFKKKYNVEVIVIEVQGSYVEKLNMTYPSDLSSPTTPLP